VNLTGLVIAQDEERDLPRCLEALSFCDERLVIDGGSQDRTAEVAKAAGARVLVHPWPGYAAQRRYGLSAAGCPWVLAVDADEVVNVKLRTAIVEALKAPQALGYEVRVESWLAGRRLRFGGVGSDFHLRLLQREGTLVTKALVHEGYRVRGPVGRLPGALVHHSYADVAELAQKVDRYSSLGAMDAYARGRRPSRAMAMARLPFGFTKRYLFQLGFLDGYAGFTFAAVQAYGDFLKGAKLRELMERGDG
jgi:glycosyltransferase involved in cell wall biosynthesis